MSVDIIVLAAIAVFVLLRLYGVLGQQTGRDDPSSSVRDTTFDSNSKVIELTPKQLERAQSVVVEAEEERDESLSDDIHEGVKALRKEDRAFRLKHFMEGAKVAFDMVLDAFAKNDSDTLKQLLSKELFQEFSTSLKQREKQDEFAETTLVSILEATPTAVVMEGKIAKITVHFLSEQVQITRKANGDRVEDSVSEIEQVQDEWVFSRDTRSSNPNWTIIAN
jgi:predicted lipid-binding transport protein (Tim44 family)